MIKTINSIHCITKSKSPCIQLDNVHFYIVVVN